MLTPRLQLMKDYEALMHLSLNIQYQCCDCLLSKLLKVLLTGPGWVTQLVSVLLICHGCVFDPD